MRLSTRVFFLILIVGWFSPAIHAQIEVLNPEVIDTTTIGIARPQGITFHPQRGTLFVVTPSQVFELSLGGSVLNSFSIETITKKAEDIAFDPATGRLLICDGTSRIFQINVDGTIPDPAVIAMLQGELETDGLAVDPVDGTFWIAHEKDGDPKTAETQQVMQFDRTGTLLARFSTKEILTSFTEPQGLGFFGSDLLVTDDSEGTQTLYLLSKSGALIQFVLDTTKVGLVDPEGIALIQESRVAVVSDKDSKLLFFDIGRSPVPQNFLPAPTSIGVPNTFVGVAAVNSVTATNTAQIEAFQTGGQSGAVTAPTATIAGLGQTAFLTSERTDPDAVQTLLLKGQAGPLQGFFMLGDFDLRRLDGIGRPFEASTSLFLPEARRAGGDTTVLSIFNPSADLTTRVEVHLFGADGAPLRHSSVTLSPFGSFVGPLERLFDDRLTVEDGFIRLKATAPVQSFVTIVKNASFSTVAGQLEKPVRKLVAPHFFVGPQGTTKVRVLNLESQPVLIAIHLFGNDGLRLAATSAEVGGQRLQEFDLTQLAREGRLAIPDFGTGKTIGGFLEIEIRGVEQRRVIGVVNFEANNAEMAASLPVLEKGDTHTLFLHVAQSPKMGVFHGLAIVNLAHKDNRITVQAFSQDGVKTREVTFVLPAKHRAIGLLNEPLFFGPDFEQAGGYLRVISDSEAASFSLFGGDHFLSAVEGQSTLNNRSFRFLRQ